MKRLVIGFTLVLITLAAYSQNDAEAIKILDRFSAIALAAPSVSMKFNLETVDQLEGTKNNVAGSIILSRDRYRLDMTNNIIWFNGETSWSYLPDEKEVTISRPDREDDSFQTRPSAIFSIYKKGYKVRLVEEKASSYLIDLYPEDNSSDHIRIRLNIEKSSLDLKSIEYKYKNGITATLTVSEYDLKQNPDNSGFTFPSEKYKGVEVIDMR